MKHQDSIDRLHGNAVSLPTALPCNLADLRIERAVLGELMRYGLLPEGKQRRQAQLNGEWKIIGFRSQSKSLIEGQDALLAHGLLLMSQAQPLPTEAILPGVA